MIVPVASNTALLQPNKGLHNMTTANKKKAATKKSPRVLGLSRSQEIVPKASSYSEIAILDALRELYKADSTACALASSIAAALGQDRTAFNARIANSVERGFVERVDLPEETATWNLKYAFRLTQAGMNYLAELDTARSNARAAMRALT